MGEPELKYYTSGQIRDWLLLGIQVDGLSDKMIARQRAWAIVNNPYVKEDDAILSVISIDGEVIAYTACFPEVLADVHTRIWWLTTLSCKSEFAGHGFGLVVVGQLIELHKGESVLDMDGAGETVEICKMLGMQDQYKTFYRFRNKTYVNTVKGQLAKSVNILIGKVAKARKQFQKSTVAASFSLRYISFVDDMTYAFINKHSKDSLPRTQKMMNWIIQYPFMQVSPVLDRVKKDLEFTSNIAFYDYIMVQVWQNEQMAGVFALRHCPWGMSVKCLYYADKESESIVNQAIAEHILQYRPKYFDTCDESLASQIDKWGFFESCDKIMKSYSYPNAWKRTDIKNIQAWDGDMFV